MFIILIFWYARYIEAYLFKARTVQAEKQPLVGNGPHTSSRGTHHVHYDIMQQ
jgi:hypothetical protein